MGFIEDVLEDNAELLGKLFSLLEGKETQADINLDGVEFEAGPTRVKLGGVVHVTIVHGKKK